MSYNRWMPYQCYSGSLYHHGIKGMKWGVRHDRPRGGGGYIRKMRKDLDLINEHEYNRTRKSLKTEYKRGNISYAEYDTKRGEAKRKYVTQRDANKHLKQTKSRAETKADFKEIRARAMNEVPHYKLKKGLRTVDKILDGIAIGSLAVSAGAVGAGAAIVAGSYGAATAIGYGTVGAAGVAGAGARAYVGSKVRKWVNRSIS